MLFETGQLLVDGGILAGESDTSADRAWLGDHVGPGHSSRAGVGPQQRGQDRYGRGLARSIGSEKGEYLSFLDGEIESSEGSHVAVALFELSGLR